MTIPVAASLAPAIVEGVEPDASIEPGDRLDEGSEEQATSEPPTRRDSTNTFRARFIAAT
jgi:hypothetical protein